MIHPDTELRKISDDIGFGIVARRPIPRGTITWTRCGLDQVITQERCRELGPLYQEAIERYAYTDRKGDWVLCWDTARYQNHSCDANCLSPGYEFEVAVRDIAAGEELTDEYGSLNIEKDLRCLCGSPRCRGTIRPDDVKRHWREWDALIRGAFDRIGAVPQPLLPFLRDRDRRALDAVLSGERKLASSLKHYHDLAAAKQAGPPRSGAR